jgi:hypothetical protein
VLTYILIEGGEEVAAVSTQDREGRTYTFHFPYAPKDAAEQAILQGLGCIPQPAKTHTKNDDNE